MQAHEKNAASLVNNSPNCGSKLQLPLEVIHLSRPAKNQVELSLSF